MLEIMKVFQNPLQLIGNTPLLQLTRLVTNKNARVYMKLEMFNLTGSVKDRAAKYLIESAEKKGLINPGTTIVESTSGNLGLALAAICAYKNYRLICVVDPKIETNRCSLTSTLRVESYLHLRIKFKKSRACEIHKNLLRSNGL